MVAYDEPGLVPIKRTLQKIDYQNQVCKELEVSHERLNIALCYFVILASFFFMQHIICAHNDISRLSMLSEVLQVCFSELCECVSPKVMRLDGCFVCCCFIGQL